MHSGIKCSTSLIHEKICSKMANNVDKEMNGLRISNGLPSPAPLMDMVMGFQKTQIVYTATRLCVFEELYRRGKPSAACSIAQSLGLEPAATERLLGACASLGLLQASRGLDSTVEYECSTLTRMYLLKSSHMSLKPLVENVGNMYTLYGNLPTVVKEGQRENGTQMFDGFYGSESQKLSFMNAMHMFTLKDCRHILAAFDFSKYSTICDLGGCTGALAAEIAKAAHSSQVVSFDLPRVTKVAQHFHDNLPSNLQFISGDFFVNALPAADLYILSNVLHDFSHDKVAFLLRAICDSQQKGGTLLILEKVLNELRDGPAPSCLMDMNMLVGAEGRERSAAEYEALLKEAGFTSVAVAKLPHAMYRDIISAQKL